MNESDWRLLKERNFEVAETLYPKITDDLNFLDTLNLSPDGDKRVLEAMLEVARARTDSMTKRVFHAADAIVLLALSFIVYSVFFLDRSPVAPKMANQVVVKAPDGLAPFQIIRPADVEIRNSIKSYTALTTVEKVLGRYVTEWIPPGQVINKTKISLGPILSNELNGLRIFTVKLNASPLLKNPPLPIKIGLIPAPHVVKVEPKPMIYDVYLLQINFISDGIAAVVASTAADATILGSMAGTSNFVAVAPGR